jgi:hypothetical protein
LVRRIACGGTGFTPAGANGPGLSVARDEAALAAKRQRLIAEASFQNVSGTVAEATGLPGRDQNAEVQLFTFRNDAEMIELVESDIMPHLV